MEFEFEKFVKDIKIREENFKQQKSAAEHIIEEDRRRRLRNEQYNERWQNRIVWSDTNGQ